MPNATPRPRRGLVIEPPEFAAFTSELCTLARSTNLSNTAIARRAGRNRRTGLPLLTSSDVCRLTSGAGRLSETKVLAFVKACGGDRAKWRRRYRDMAAAVKRHRDDLSSEIVDKPYTELSPPTSPLRFNLQLQRRINRAPGKSQNQIAREAHFSPQKASNDFKSNLVASRDFTVRMLRAAGAEQDEIDTWLRWRDGLDRLPETAPPKAPAPESNGAAIEPRKERKKGGKGPQAGAAAAVLLFVVIMLSSSKGVRVTDGDPTAAPPPAKVTPWAPPSATQPPFSQPRLTPSPRPSKAPSTSTPRATTSTPPTPRAATPIPSPPRRDITGTIVDPTGQGDYLSSEGWMVGQTVTVRCEIVDGNDAGSYRTANGKAIQTRYVRFEQLNPTIPPCED